MVVRLPIGGSPCIGIWGFRLWLAFHAYPANGDKAPVPGLKLSARFEGITEFQFDGYKSLELPVRYQRCIIRGNNHRCLPGFVFADAIKENPPPNSKGRNCSSCTTVNMANPLKEMSFPCSRSFSPRQGIDRKSLPRGISAKNHLGSGCQQVFATQTGVQFPKGRISSSVFFERDACTNPWGEHGIGDLFGAE